MYCVTVISYNCLSRCFRAKCNRAGKIENQQLTAVETSSHIQQMALPGTMTIKIAANLVHSKLFYQWEKNL